MLEDGERVLDIVGVLLVGAVLLGLLVVALNFGTAASGADIPDANWTVSQVNDTHVRITHAGGDPVPASKLFVTVDSLRRSATWEGVVSGGDSAIVRAREGGLVRLYFDGGRREKEVLAKWRIGETG